MTVPTRRPWPHRAVLLAASAALALSLAGCGAGDPAYYTLSPVPGAVRNGAPAVTEIRMPTIASFLDRDYIVSGTSDYRLQLAGNQAWAEPIGQLIGRVLTADLAQRLPGTSVFEEGDAAATPPDAVVSLDIGRFDKDSDGHVVVAGTLAVSRGKSGWAGPAPAPLDRFHVEATPDGPGTAAFAATLSRLLARVADRAADRLVTLPVSPIAPDGAGGAR